ncbi:Lipase domain containing protein [Aphelenchoides fujianensis]|nr:Lipase domain containing protein [Aphelenchoides fujianensis]
MRLSLNAAVILVVLLVACTQLSEAFISQSFFKFLKLRYGWKYANDIARYDYGPVGSFGGGQHVAGRKTKKTPAIFVAGWASTASFAWPSALVWMMHGYGLEELYGSTYGLPAGPFSITWGLRCQYVNATRTLIKAVAEFTNSSVNLFGLLHLPLCTMTPFQQYNLVHKGSAL